MSRDRDVRRRPVWNGASAVALVVLLATGGLAAVVSSLLRGAEQRRGDDLMDRRSVAIQAAVRAEMKRYTDALATMSAAVGAQSYLSASDFDAITAPLAGFDLPGATGFALAVPATDAQIDSVQAYWRERGSNSLVLDPDPARPEHIFAVLRRSLDGSPSTLGQDVSSAELMSALETARRTGTVTASATYVLRMDRDLPVDQQQLSFVVTAAVYGPTIESDQAPFVGWVAMGLRGGDFMAETLHQVSQGLDVRLLDQAADGGLVAVASIGDQRDRTDDKLRRTTIEVGGQVWTIETRATPEFAAEYETPLDEVALIMGLALSLLLAWLFFVIVRGRAFALDKVRRATETLRDDILHRKLVEGDLRATQSALEVAARARGEFVSTVSHELRTPLTSIQGYSEMLTDGEAGALTEDQQKMVDVVDRNARRLLALVDDLLSVSSIQSGTLHLDRAIVDVTQIVEGVVDALMPSIASHNLQLDLVVAPAVGSVVGDRSQLERVMLNLLSNAVKYTPDGGRIGLDVRMDGTMAVIMVRDTGIGIPLDEQSSLFEPFFRSSTAKQAAIKGTGLGLVIVKSVIEAHGGDVQFRSAPGQGTTVTVRLPTEPALARAGVLSSAGSR